jgi:hypothetical protein
MMEHVQGKAHDRQVAMFMPDTDTPLTEAMPTMHTGTSLTLQRFSMLPPYSSVRLFTESLVTGGEGADADAEVTRSGNLAQNSVHKTEALWEGLIAAGAGEGMQTGTHLHWSIK